MRRADRSAAQLLRLLEAERTALMESRHSRLADLAMRKAKLVGELGSTAEGIAALADLRPQLVHNLALVGAVRAGLADLQAVVTKPSPHLRTYGPDGQTGAPVPDRAQVMRRV
jgi:hypothetical protein